MLLPKMNEINRVKSLHKDDWYNLLEILIILALMIPYIFLAINTPIYSDGAFVADIVEEIANTGKIIEVSPHVMVASNMNYPLFYPLGYFVGIASLQVIIGENAYDVISIISVLLLILASYSLMKSFVNKRILLIILPILISNYHIMLFGSSRLRGDITVFSLMMISFYALYKFMQSPKKYNWLFISAILIAGCLIQKQQSFFMLLFLGLTILYYSLTKNVILSKKTALILILSLILASPILIFQFTNTGTIFYIADQPPLISDVESTVSNYFGITRYELNPKIIEFGKFSDFGKSRLDYSKTFHGILTSISPIKALPIQVGLFFIICGILYSVKNIKNPFSIIFLLNYIIMISVYFILGGTLDHMFIIPVISAIYFTLGILCITNKITQKYKPIIPILILIIIICSSINISNNYYSFNKIADIQQERQNNFLYAQIFLDDIDPLKDAFILTSRDSEVGYHMKRKTIWLNHINGNELYFAFDSGNDELLAKEMMENNVSYILIPKWFLGSQKTWIAYMNSETYNKLAKSKYFEEIYNQKDIAIFRLN